MYAYHFTLIILRVMRSKTRVYTLARCCRGSRQVGRLYVPCDGNNNNYYYLQAVVLFLRKHNRGVWFCFRIPRHPRQRVKTGRNDGGGGGGDEEQRSADTRLMWRVINIYESITRSVWLYPCRSIGAADFSRARESQAVTYVKNSKRSTVNGPKKPRSNRRRRHNTEWPT